MARSYWLSSRALVAGRVKRDGSNIGGDQGLVLDGMQPVLVLRLQLLQLGLPLLDVLRAACKQLVLRDREGPVSQLLPPSGFLPSLSLPLATPPFRANMRTFASSSCSSSAISCTARAAASSRHALGAPRSGAQGQACNGSELCRLRAGRDGAHPLVSRHVWLL